jgi:hypothetical protein
MPSRSAHEAGRGCAQQSSVLAHQVVIDADEPKHDHGRIILAILEDRLCCALIVELNPGSPATFATSRSGSMVLLV